VEGGDRSRRKEFTVARRGTSPAARGLVFFSLSLRSAPLFPMVHVASLNFHCLGCLIPMFQMFHMDVAKRYEMLRMLHMCIAGVASVLHECCKPPLP
jgi:hypothetical protein